MVNMANLNYQNYQNPNIFKYFIGATLISFALIISINQNNYSKASFVQTQPLKINLFALQGQKAKNTKQQESLKKQMLKNFVSSEDSKNNFNQKQIDKQINHKEITEKTTNSNEISNSNPNKNKDLAEIIHQANYKLQTPPHYPEVAINLGWQGRVLLHVKVLENGKISNLKIIQSSGYQILDKAAVMAVKKWQFYPTVINSKAINSIVEVPVNFVINS